MNKFILAFVVALYGTAAAAEPADPATEPVEKAVPVCEKIHSDLGKFALSAAAAERTSKVVADFLEDKTASLRRVRSREVVVDRYEMLDTLKTLSKTLTSGENVIAGRGEMLEYLLPNILGKESVCETARNLPPEFKYIPDAFKSSKGLISTVTGIINGQIANLSYGRSTDVVINAAEAANTFSTLANALRQAASTLKLAREVIEEGQAVIVPPKPVSPPNNP